MYTLSHFRHKTCTCIRGPFHEASYDKNLRKSKLETILKIFNNLPNQLKFGLNDPEKCIFSKYSIIKNVS